jgi:hypothetical protein
MTGTGKIPIRVMRLGYRRPGSAKPVRSSVSAPEMLSVGKTGRSQSSARRQSLLSRHDMPARAAFAHLGLFTETFTSNRPPRLRGDFSNRFLSNSIWSRISSR